MILGCSESLQVLWQMTVLSNTMSDKTKSKHKKPASDREALWPTDPLTDKHNDWVIEKLAKEKDNERRNHR